MSQRNNNNSKQGVLLLGRVTIGQGSVLGPYSSVTPVTSANCLTESKEMTWQGVLPALAAHTHYRSASNPKGKVMNDDAAAVRETVWTPALSSLTQFVGLLTVFVLHWAALVPGIALFYYMYINDVYYYWYALFHFGWVWIFGTPLALLVVLYKWLIIGKFREGPSTPSLDARRWVLQCLFQSRLLQSFVFYGASSPIISLFYKSLGARIGWNAQVMPVNVLEFDLFSVGESTSFGGQVSVFARDHEGNQKKCTIGDDTAVTNSAIMLAGSSVGAGALVGDLTLLPTDTHVPAGSKCVGNPHLVFPSQRQPPSKHVHWSNWIMFLHAVGSVMLEVVSQPSWLAITFGVFASPWVATFSDGGWGVNGYGGFALIIVIMLIVMIVCFLLSAIVLKRICSSFVGTYARDSWTFVQFMFLTKMIVNVDVMLLRMLGGTPWMPLVYRLMGVNASLSACMLNRHTADIDMLTVGDGAVLDFDSYIELHHKTADELSFEPIVIGDDAVVGARSILLRGSEVEQSSQLHGLSMVLPGEPVTKGSVWGGLPSSAYYTPSATEQLRSSIAALGDGRLSMGANKGVGGYRRQSQRRLSMRTSAMRTSAMGGDAGVGAGAGRTSLIVARGQRQLDNRMSARLERMSQRLPSTSTSTAAAAAARSSQVPSIIVDSEAAADEVDVGMVVIGAGNMGLMAAHEFKKAGESVLVLEKTGTPMGCWRAGYGANPTSHVAVSEPAYRFPLPGTSDTSGASVHAEYPSDYTPQPELLQQGDRFIKEQGLDEVINYHCTVSDVAHISSKPPRVDVTYSNSRTGETKTVIARGVYIAIGAQQQARELVWEGEAAFDALPATTVGYGVKGDIDASSAFRGKRVVIIGNGAFAVENARTALMHGAEHVTLVYRRAFQTWPRVVHYLASLGGLTFAQLGAHYDAWKRWAGMDEEGVGKDAMDGFMSLNTFSQPSASDFVFGAHKAGLLSIRKDEVAKCVVDVGDGSGPGVVLKNSGDTLPCEVFLKCIGWRMPDLRKIMPGFETRNWCFLNSTPNIVFACDPHYQLDAANSSDSGSAPAAGAGSGKHQAKKAQVAKKMAAARHAHMMQMTPKGGTFSNIVLARATARMQLFMMGKPRAFDAALAQLPSSNSAMCSWFEQRWEFEGIPQLNAVIDEVLEEGKKAMRARFPDMDSFVSMASSRFAYDMGKTKLVSRKQADLLASYPMPTITSASKISLVDSATTNIEP